MPKPTIPPSINIGTAGHVDEGKSTLIKLLTNKFPDEHSEELKRGITIRLGYADCDILRCPSCDDPECWTIYSTCPHCGSETKVDRRVSFVDAPGHEILMNVMLSGAAIMDAVMLLISATNTVPQPQTREHLAALTALGVNNIIIVQNKIDLVSKEAAIKNYQDIKKFIKGTIAENAPIIPISSLHGENLDVLLSAIQEFLPDPDRELDIPPTMMVARSFDINRPGTQPSKLKGGVFGGSILSGTMRVGDDIVILPGLKKKEKNKIKYIPVKTKVKSINMGVFGSVKSATPGGLLGVQTTIDPSMARSDNLSGSILVSPDALLPVVSAIELDITLFEKVVGSNEDLTVHPIAKNEALLLTIGTATAVGVVEVVKKNIATVRIKSNVAIVPDTKIAISRNFDKRWRLIGWATIKGYEETEIEVVN
ncbi:MAG: translation initiation factor IF-2 subunit gamma [Candidatus Heimdallarchaeota archaeon]|nr:translation initiation factor IF-2 subunit gamma [Candidatus Heimdallarchaeota archaeon]